MSIKNKRIFMTGGAGFIGASLCERLIDSNEIVVFDTLHRNSIVHSKIAKNRNLKMVKGDVLDKDGMRKAMKGSDIIVHLAAIAGVDSVIGSPIKTMTINYVGTSNALEVANGIGHIDRFVNFSTSEVYGAYAYKKGEEESTNMGAVGAARWTYAISKLAAEHLAHNYYKEHNLPVVSVRPFNIYGPGQVGEGAIQIFINAALGGKYIEVHGDGDQIRSWCYVDDIVDGLMLCLEKDRAVGEVFNIGNPKCTCTILSLAEKVIQVTKSKSKIRFVPKPYVDVELRIPDIDKIRELLKFEPKITLEEGISRTAEWYRARGGK